MKNPFIAIVTIVCASLAAGQVMSGVSPVPAVQFAASGNSGVVVADTDGTIHQASLTGLVLSRQADGSYLLSATWPVIPTLIRNEVPAVSGTNWVLLHTPNATGASCWRNGVRQSPGSDYTLAGAVITSAFWQRTDALACDYQY